MEYNVFPNWDFSNSHDLIICMRSEILLFLNVDSTSRNVGINHHCVLSETKQKRISWNQLKIHFLQKQRHEICANWTSVNYKTLTWMERLRQTRKDKKFVVFVTLELGLPSMCFSRPLKLANLEIHDDTLFYFCKRNVCCGGFCCFQAMCAFFLLVPSGLEVSWVSKLYVYLQKWF